VLLRSLAGIIWFGRSEKMLEEIREATNKSWVLGSDFCKEMIEDKINRLMDLRRKGGDSKYC